MDVEGDVPMNTAPVDNVDATAPGLTSEPKESKASPRLIPVPESPRVNVDPLPSGKPTTLDEPSDSFDNQCVPSQAPNL